MLISGSQTQCISEAINSEYPFDATQLPGFTKLHAMLGHEPATDKCLPTLPFTEFLKKCQMIYDYVHQRVIVYAPSITYAYVYSLKTQQWGMIFSRIASHLNSYPDALAVDADNAVLNFSVPKAEAVKCLYTTRPLKLEAANVLKPSTASFSVVSSAKAMSPRLCMARAIWSTGIWYGQAKTTICAVFVDHPTSISALQVSPPSMPMKISSVRPCSSLHDRTTSHADNRPHGLERLSEAQQGLSRYY